MPTETAEGSFANHRRVKFTTLLNKVVLDSTLALEEKGLLLVMLSRPDGWTYRLGWVEAQSANGRDAHRKVLAKLEARGFVSRAPHRLPDGTVKGWDFIVTDEPESAPGQLLDRLTENQ